MLKKVVSSGYMYCLEKKKLMKKHCPDATRVINFSKRPGWSDSGRFGQTDEELE